ncbi:MAG: class I SAM-dependent rRNA methyltransferase [Deltaproteobacteria bacterium]|nr:class I SAM-dependent rRNA methyltransferase [Deltaproteobacteria bacterium]
MEKVVLKRTSRIIAGHPWVFSNELLRSPKIFESGALVEVYGKDGVFFGIGYVNPQTLIAIRILTRKREEIDAGFFKRRISAALSYRQRFFEDRDSFRAVFSEGDFLPGLIVDKYAGCVSVQMLTAGMEKLSEIALEAIADVLKPSVVVLRNDSNSRGLEGLPLEKKVVLGSIETLPVIKDNDAVFEVDPMSGQKTGFFLDQAANRRAFAELAGSGTTALDLFCYTGAWAVTLAKKGVSVIGVDSSVGAIAQAQRNAELNGVNGRCSFVKADVFDFVKNEVKENRRYDCIVLDPPAFVKSKANLREAARAYREINAACMKLVKKNGLLATSSCSYHMDKALFTDTLRLSAKDAGKTVRLIEARSQSPDHPILLRCPETEYLKCFILEVS